jgi:hypothetical protein
LRREAGLYLRRHMAPTRPSGGIPRLHRILLARQRLRLARPEQPEGCGMSRSVPQTERSMEKHAEEPPAGVLLLRDVEVLYTMKMPAWLTGGYHPVAAFVLPLIGPAPSGGLRKHRHRLPHLPQEPAGRGASRTGSGMAF